MEALASAFAEFDGLWSADGSVGSEQSSFDEAAFSRELSAYVSCAARCSSLQASKSERESEAQKLFEAMWKNSESVLSGVCGCGTLVKTTAHTLSFDERAATALLDNMNVIQTASCELTLALVDECVAQCRWLKSVATLLLLGADIPLPPKRAAPLSPRGHSPPTSPRKHQNAVSNTASNNSSSSSHHNNHYHHQNARMISVLRNVLFCIHHCMEALANGSIASASVCQATLKSVVVELGHRLNTVILSSMQPKDSFEQVRDLYRADGTWKEMDRVLKSPSTMDSDALHISHVFVLRKVLELGADAGWARSMLAPGRPQILSNWLGETLLVSNKVYSEEALLVALSVFDLEKGEHLTIEQVLSLVLLPVQKAFERYAEHKYYRLAIALSKIVVSAARLYPVLMTKCLAILSSAPAAFLAQTLSQLDVMPWNMALEGDVDTLVAAIIGCFPALGAAEFAALSSADRTRHRFALAQSLLEKERTLQSASAFTSLDALASLAQRLAPDHPVAVMVAEELLFYSLVNVSSGAASLQAKALSLFSKCTQRSWSPKIGSQLVDLCVHQFALVDAERISAVMSCPCFESWVPSAADMRGIASLACHRTLSTDFADGAEGVDRLIEELLHGLPNIPHSAQTRGVATRNGGQILMGVRWGSCPLLTQLTAGCILISSKFIGMPASWVTDTMLSEKASLLALAGDAALATSATATTELSDSVIQMAEKLMQTDAPHALVQIEWRILKGLVGLYLCSWHQRELLSSSLSDSGSGGGSLLRFSRFHSTWLDLSKMHEIIPTISSFSACRFLSRVAVIGIGFGDSFRLHLNTMTYAIASLLQFENITPIALKYHLAPLLADAANSVVQFEDYTKLQATAGFWREVLWPLVIRGTNPDARVLLEAVIHTSYSLSVSDQWLAFEGATVEQALSLARDGFAFFAIAVAASVTPAQPPKGFSGQELQQSAVGALLQLAVQLSNDKAAALFCWIKLAQAMEDVRVPQSLVVLVQEQMKGDEKDPAFGVVARRFFAALLEGVKETGNFPHAESLMDSSLKKFIWSKRPAPVSSVNSASSISNASVSGPELDSSSRKSFNLRLPNGASSSSSSSSSSPAPFSLPVGLSASRIVVSSDSLLQYAIAKARDLVLVLSEIRELEREFIVRSKDLYVSQITQVPLNCLRPDSACTGGTSVQYAKPIQSPQVLEVLLRNRNRFRDLSTKLRALSSVVACSSVLIESASPDQQGARAMICPLVGALAERVFVRSRPFAAFAERLLTLVPQEEYVMDGLRAFLDGCEKRVSGEDKGVLCLEDLDGLDGGERGVALNFFDPRVWLKNGQLELVVEALRITFSKSNALSAFDFRVLLHRFALEQVVPALVLGAAQDPGIGVSFLCLLPQLVSLPDHSSLVVSELLSSFPLADVFKLLADLTECWASTDSHAVSSAKRQIAFRGWSATFVAKDIPSSPPHWQAAWFSASLSKALAALPDEKERASACSSIAQSLIRVLAARKRPPTALTAIRKLLPAISAAPWPELSQCLRLCCPVTGLTEASLKETADLIAKCAPDIDASFSAWITWNVFAATAEEFAERILRDVLAPVWQKTAWFQLQYPTLSLFLVEASKASGNKTRLVFLLRSLAAFRQFQAPEDLLNVKRRSVILVAQICALRTVVDQSRLADAALIPLVTKLDWSGLLDDDVSLDEASPDRISHLLAEHVTPAVEGDLISLLENMSSSMAKSCASLKACYLFCRGCVALLLVVQNKVPFLVRVVLPLCRRIGTSEEYGKDACDLMVKACHIPSAEPEVSDKLRGVLQSFVSSLTDPSVCLNMLQSIPRVVHNPRVAVPLTEMLLQSYFSCAVPNPLSNPLEVAASVWNPPSLPEGAKSEFPIHDVAASCQAHCACTLMLMLERQRLLAPPAYSVGDSARLWSESFACPATATVYGLNADTKRPFDAVGIWIWLLKHVISPFRPALHKDLAKLVVDFVSLMDDLWLNHLPLFPHASPPYFLEDRVRLVAGCVSCFGIRLTVAAVHGTEEEAHKNAGVGLRVGQLSKRAAELGCEAFSKSILRLPTCTVDEFGQAVFNELFPMARYLVCVFSSSRSSRAPAPQVSPTLPPEGEKKDEQSNNINNNNNNSVADVVLENITVNVQAGVATEEKTKTGEEKDENSKVGDVDDSNRDNGNNNNHDIIEESVDAVKEEESVEATFVESDAQQAE